MNEISADILEQAAMAKSYNTSAPDEILIDEPIIVEKLSESPLSKISKWISDTIIQEVEGLPDSEEIEVYRKDGWRFKGLFKTGILGEYRVGEILEFSEIYDSEELSELDKRELLQTIIEQRELSIAELKDDLIDDLFLIMFNHWQDDLSYEYFKKHHVIDFIKTENIHIDDESEESIYKFFKSEIDSYSKEDIQSLQNGEAVEELAQIWRGSLSYIDYSLFTEKLITIGVKVSPEFVIFTCSIFGEKKHFVLTEANKLIEWK